jgi:hypothetical protein
MAEIPPSGGTAPDNESITKDSNGDLRVNKPSDDVFGDFGDNDKGNWTGGDVKDLDWSGTNGKYNIQFGNNRSTDIISKNIDFTDIDTLTLTYGSYNSGEEFEIRIGGSVVFSTTSSPNEGTLNLDVSGKTGTQTIELEAITGTFRMDNMYRDKSKNRINKGAGGVE